MHQVSNTGFVEGFKFESTSGGMDGLFGFLSFKPPLGVCQQPPQAYPANSVLLKNHPVFIPSGEKLPVKKIAKTIGM